MKHWITAVFTLSLLSIVALTLAWRHYVYAPMKTQAEFSALMQDAAPLLKRRYYDIRTELPNSLSTLLGAPELSETAQNDAEPTISYKDEIELKLSNLTNIEPRFAALNHHHLAPCQSDEAYSKWGELKYWAAQTVARENEIQSIENAAAAYEATAAQYAGRPITMAEIKAVGQAQYDSVQAELKTLEADVQSGFGLDLDAFALRDENFSTSSAAIIERLSPLLANIETTLASSGDFEFASVPAASIQTREGYGPNFAIASYETRKNTMVIYWADGRYNHIYDTMLAVHEIMPGHHLQIKMDKRRVCGLGPISARTSFLEGWATYAEILADERGLFDAPDQRLGWLDYRLVRAMRIIMDIARTENGLTEPQAWAMWQEKMPKRLNEDFPREWARVNKSPHHLSYIFGSQAILQARETLRETLGAKFDEAEFHAVLLNAQHLNLMFIPERVEAQMRARKQLDLPMPAQAETSL